MPKPIVAFDEQAVRAEPKEPVRKTVEETLNALLEQEADDLVGAGRHGRRAGREAYRAGRCKRSLTTTSGEVELKMPELEGVRFATAVIERHRRRESSVEEATIEMCLAGVSTRRVGDVSEALRGASVPAPTVSNLNERAFKAAEAWRGRRLERAHP